MSLHVNLLLDDHQQAELERIAEGENLSVEELLTRLARQRIEHDAKLRADIQVGLASAEREPLVDHDEVFAILDNRIRARVRK
jgi:predicted transcriptional regulator